MESSKPSRQEIQTYIDQATPACLIIHYRRFPETKCILAYYTFPGQPHLRRCLYLHASKITLCNGFSMTNVTWDRCVSEWHNYRKIIDEWLHFEDHERRVNGEMIESVIDDDGVLGLSRFKEMWHCGRLLCVGPSYLEKEKCVRPKVDVKQEEDETHLSA